MMLEPAGALRHLVGQWRAMRRLRACSTLGNRTRVVGEPWVENLGRIDIGEDFDIEALPIPTHLVTGPSGHIRIGNRVRVAHGVAICSHLSIEIGEGSTLGPFAIVIDADFHGVQSRSAASGPRAVRIGRNVHIGAGTIILRGAVLGDGVVVAPNSVVSRWIPAGMRVAGVPAKPIREAEVVRRPST